MVASENELACEGRLIKAWYKLNDKVLEKKVWTIYIFAIIMIVSSASCAFEFLTPIVWLIGFYTQLILKKIPMSDVLFRLINHIHINLQPLCRLSLSLI